MSLSSHEAEFIVNILIKKGIINSKLKQESIITIQQKTCEKIYFIWSIDDINKRIEELEIDNNKLTSDDKIAILDNLEDTDPSENMWDCIDQSLKDFIEENDTLPLPKDQFGNYDPKGCF